MVKSLKLGVFFMAECFIDTGSDLMFFIFGRSDYCDLGDGWYFVGNDVGIASVYVGFPN